MSFDVEVRNDEPITAEDFLIDKKDEKKRRREEKRRRKQYKFSDKKHSVLGVISSLLAIYALAAIVVAIVLATEAAGDGGLIVGILGALAFVLSLAGIICGLLAFRKTDVYYQFAWAGLIANGIIWLLMAILIVMAL